MKEDLNFREYVMAISRKLREGMSKEEIFNEYSEKYEFDHDKYANALSRLVDHKIKSKFKPYMILMVILFFFAIVRSSFFVGEIPIWSQAITMIVGAIVLWGMSRYDAKVFLYAAILGLIGIGKFIFFFDQTAYSTFDYVQILAIIGTIVGGLLLNKRLEREYELYEENGQVKGRFFLLSEKKNQ